MQADPNKKNMERMEERVPGSDQQQMNHMLTDPEWDHRAVIDQVALEADGWFGGHRNCCLLIDESGFRKSGKHSVGVARQWCGRWGKVDNCQVGVFAALGGGNQATLVDERLYLPVHWVEDDYEAGAGTEDQGAVGLGDCGAPSEAGCAVCLGWC